MMFCFVPSINSRIGGTGFFLFKLVIQKDVLGVINIDQDTSIASWSHGGQLKKLHCGTTLEHYFTTWAQLEDHLGSTRNSLVTSW